MDTRIRDRVLTALAWAAVLSIAAPAVAAAQADSLPPGVTKEMVTKGKSVFLGAGLCLACHGQDGKGVIGPNLTDQTWLHIDGSYDAIITQILSGVDASQSKTGQIMPPKGGSAISDADVKAVAAYVWTLSHKGKGK
jgi:mono/diheme cytochrome c family protein